MLDKSYADLEEIKRALLIASPAEFAQKVFPEIFGEEKNSNIDEVIDTMSTGEENPEIDFDLTPPSSREAKRVSDMLLADKTGTLKL